MGRTFGSFGIKHRGLRCAGSMYRADFLLFILSFLSTLLVEEHGHAGDMRIHDR